MSPSTMKIQFNSKPGKIFSGLDKCPRPILFPIIYKFRQLFSHTSERLEYL